ncbi:MAG: mannitol dehydrogenase family protein [Paracoccaceae bacterium]
MPKRILQFGTSRFLQAHADLFVHQARQEGQDIGPITVVKISPGLERAGRLSYLARPEGFPVEVRGVVEGRMVQHTHVVTSVTATLSAIDDWPRLLTVFASETEIVISNVGETGYDIPPSDRIRDFGPSGIPTSFPAKLLALLSARFAAGAKPLLVLPCELVAFNGAVLRRALTGLAEDWSVSREFGEWLENSVTICNTLVDRIVPLALDPIGAVAEPYALWAIEYAPGTILPFTHPSVVPTPDIEPFMRLKLHILNLGHTYLAKLWIDEARNPAETVRQILLDPDIRQKLLSLYNDEVIPGFAEHGMAEAAVSYVRTTMDRFDNPFLAHPLADIAQNHDVKIARRCQAFLDWVRATDTLPPMPRLTQICSSLSG